MLSRVHLVNEADDRLNSTIIIILVVCALPFNCTYFYPSTHQLIYIEFDSMLDGVMWQRSVMGEGIMSLVMFDCFENDTSTSLVNLRYRYQILKEKPTLKVKDAGSLT